MPADNESNSPWPGYRTYPERLNLAREVLARSIQRGLGDRPALIGDSGSVTYETLERQVNAVATGLIQLGLKQGDLP
jgi:acyl-coenzyme A synthetase/AMP-(fatty) acid ligase